MEFRNGGVNLHIVIDVSGNVGIGTIAPRSKFMIVGDGRRWYCGFKLIHYSCIDNHRHGRLDLSHLSHQWRRLQHHSIRFGYLLRSLPSWLGTTTASSWPPSPLAADSPSEGRCSPMAPTTANCTGIGAPVSGCIDYAENMPTSDSSITAGDIISISPDSLNVTKSLGKGDNAILGIVSTGLPPSSPAMTLSSAMRPTAINRPALSRSP